MRDDRSTVEVPENALRQEPLAFGLTAPQLALAGAAALLALAINVLPLPLPLRILLIFGLAGPIVVAAVLPIRGEPAYRWLRRVVRYRTTKRRWQAALLEPDKPLVSDAGDTEPVHPPGNVMESPKASQPEVQVELDATSEPEQPAEAVPDVGVPPPHGRPQLRVVGHAEAEADEPPAVIPHLLGGLRLACFLSFAGGVGKTTLAVETATLVGSRARYRTLEGVERPVRVLLVDAARTNAATHLRLGLDADTVSRLQTRFDWPDEATFDGRVVATDHGTDALALPPLPLQGLGPPLPFGSIEADAILGAAERAGYQLLVVDLGGLPEEGHRYLIDQAALVLAVVGGRIDSLPDVLRVAAYVRALGAGRKLVVIGNAIDDEGTLRLLAEEAAVAIAAVIPRLDAFVAAGDRGVPGWTIDRRAQEAVLPVAAAVWPLLGATARSARSPLDSALTAVRRAIFARGR